MGMGGVGTDAAPHVGNGLDTASARSGTEDARVEAERRTAGGGAGSSSYSRPGTNSRAWTAPVFAHGPREDDALSLEPHARESGRRRLRQPDLLRVA